MTPMDQFIRVKYEFRTDKGTRISMGLHGKVLLENKEKTLVEFGSGDPFWLPSKALETWEPCHSCNMLRINGVVTHETGCPDAWRDEIRECKECGSEFLPTEQRLVCCCDICMVTYNNFSCDCEICREQVEEDHKDDPIEEEVA